jgi:hypothetical protein
MWTLTTRVCIPTSTTALGRSTRIYTLSRGEQRSLFSLSSLHLCIPRSRTNWNSIITPPNAQIPFVPPRLASCARQAGGDGTGRGWGGNFVSFISIFPSTRPFFYPSFYPLDFLFLAIPSTSVLACIRLRREASSFFIYLIAWTMRRALPCPRCTFHAPFSTLHETRRLGDPFRAVHSSSLTSLHSSSSSNINPASHPFLPPCCVLPRSPIVYRISYASFPPHFPSASDAPPDPHYLSHIPHSSLSSS